MRQSLRRCVLAALAGIFVVAMISETASAADSTRTLSAVADKDAALQRALEFTGFAQAIDKAALSAEKMVSRAKAVDSITPFLSDRINGRDVWLVKCDSVYLNLPGWMPDAIKGQVRKDYTVTIDCATGQLLHVQGLASDKRRSELQPLLSAVATKRMKGNGEEIVGFCQHAPRASMLDAISVAAASQPMSALQLEIWLVEWSDMGKAAIPVWMIIAMPVREYASDRGTGESLFPVWERERSIVDAEDGKARVFTNTP